MRVLWVCNIMPPVIGEYLGKECSVKEGWISGILARLAKEKEEIELGICYPVMEELEEAKQEIRLENSKNITTYGFFEDTVHPEIYGGAVLEKRLQEIIEDFQPEVLHIFGTEFGHSLAAAKAMGQPARTLIGLQGVISECAKEYMADLSREVQSQVSFRDWLKNDSMKQQQQKFFIRGEREKEALKYCGHITGRTEFDKAAAEKMNPEAIYHLMNETMRGEFYEGQWDREKCVKHSIFFSQADYPLKGFHYLLQALKEIKMKYPDVSVKVAGNSLVSYQTMKDKIKISAYGKYLRQLIKELQMEDKITFLGKLTAEEMKQQYLQCHTFVCASSLENSPNSVGEAMLLGTPVVASNTGGIPSMVTHEQEGFLFEKGKVDALAKAIMGSWEEDSLVDEMSKNARRKARDTHNADKNYEVLKGIYTGIAGFETNEI